MVFVVFTDILERLLRDEKMEKRELTAGKEIKNQNSLEKFG